MDDVTLVSESVSEEGDLKRCYAYKNVIYKILPKPKNPVPLSGNWVTFTGNQVPHSENQVPNWKTRNAPIKKPGPLFRQ